MISQAHLDRLATDGCCVVEGVLDPAQADSIRACLVQAAEASRQQGIDTFMPVLDPNPSNVRVFGLLEHDQIFRDLVAHPKAVEMVRRVVGKDFLISNLTANIALPGSKSMAVHSDQALVFPEPWMQTFAVNIIWCLDDVTAANGGTLYLPGSHRFTHRDQLPPNPRSLMTAFEAPKGSMVVMDGRMWHTSGANVTQDQERALLFGYYTAPFIRPQVNWNAILSAPTQSTIKQPLFDWLGLGPEANVSNAAPQLVDMDLT